MFDTAKTLSTTKNNKVLQDLRVAITLYNNIELQINQFKALSLTESINTSSGNLLLAKQSRIARFYTEKRDPKTILSYKHDFWKIAVSGTNGLGNNGTSSTANQTDPNRSKDFHARIDTEFMEKALKFGLFHSDGIYGDGLTATTPAKAKGHNGADIRYKFERTNLNLAYVAGKDDTTESTGIVAEVGYKFTDELQLAARHDSLTIKPASGTELNSTATGFSLNYLISGNNAKVQLSHFLLNNMTGGYGSYTQTSTTRDASSVTILALQTSI
jgi:hypothetical protein